MPGELGDQGDPAVEYDWALRTFVGETEQITRSQSRVWHTNTALGFLVLVVFLAWVSIGSDRIADIANGLIPLSIGDQSVGFGILVWFASALAIGFIAFGYSRLLYYSDLANRIASEFNPDAEDLVERDYLEGGPSEHPITDLRRQFHESYEHTLARTFLEEEYRDYHGTESAEEGGKGNRGGRIAGFLRSFVIFLSGGRWISLDPRREGEPPYRYGLEATFWPHAFLRSLCLGLFWGSLGGWCVAWATGLGGLVDLLLLLAVAFFVLYFVQFALFWGRIEKLSEGLEAAETDVVPYACPNCQAALTVGQDCSVCGQPIDWSSMASGSEG